MTPEEKQTRVLKAVEQLQDEAHRQVEFLMSKQDASIVNYQDAFNTYILCRLATIIVELNELRESKNEPQIIC